MITGEQESVVGQRVPAVNRRGRPVELQVTVTSLQSGTEGLRGVLIAMEEQPPPSAESLPAG